jgi:hypothetical protein
MLKKATELAVRMGYVDEDEEERAEGKDLSGKSPDMAASITKSIWGLFQADTLVPLFLFLFVSIENGLMSLGSVIPDF